ncbi:hypothetical protein H5407_15160 [Mitsuaria sp. WAJ17]|uniref:hypothetical protein n=1 Tax=Mitsuaria sp. WAJ17 TaxID=2761452 RepID=UPI0015FEED9A|nr:hypothetical protein [Mitsuaria sp. WAJ17]MBB2486563.1 hypothetical protein [Mitsuaria sp. WAJ17]
MSRKGAVMAAACMLAVSLFIPAERADASEVVKLTRLVLTGKRSVDNGGKAGPAQGPIERLPKVSVDGLRMDETPTQVAGQLRSGSRPS